MTIQTCTVTINTAVPRSTRAYVELGALYTEVGVNTLNGTVFEQV